MTRDPRYKYVVVRPNLDASRHLVMQENYLVTSLVEVQKLINEISSNSYRTQDAEETKRVHITLLTKEYNILRSMLEALQILNT